MQIRSHQRLIERFLLHLPTNVWTSQSVLRGLPQDVVDEAAHSRAGPQNVLWPL